MQLDNTEAILLIVLVVTIAAVLFRHRKKLGRKR